MITTILLLGYIFSCYAMYKFIKIAYSKEGRWSNIKPDGLDLFFCFTPLFNTATAIMSWVFFYPRKQKETVKKEIAHETYRNKDIISPPQHIFPYMHKLLMGESQS